MSPVDTVELRLRNQLLGRRRPSSPVEVVEWLGAIQAQDYRGALWAIGLRTSSCGEADVEQAISERRIVRTWPMRGTLHFVPARDVRWMLDLTAQRAIVGAAGRYRQLGLDDDAFTLARKLCVEALRGGRQLTRKDLYDVLAHGGVSPEGQRGFHVLSRLSQEGLLCLGDTLGKQPTFCLLEERVPNATRLSRDESLAKLAERYCASHGPATLRDFAWWSGLTLADARRGVELARPLLHREEVGGQDCWLAATEPPINEREADSFTAHLLPPYDEYTVAYRDRAAVLDPAYAASVADYLIRPAVVLDGIVAGSWRRESRGGKVTLSTSLSREIGWPEATAIEKVAERYGRFLGLPAAVEINAPGSTSPADR